MLFIHRQCPADDEGIFASEQLLIIPNLRLRILFCQEQQIFKDKI